MKKGKIINNTISKSSLIKLVQNNDIETVITAFPDMYGRLMGKRFDSKFFIKSVLDEGTHACDYLLGVDIDMEPISGYKITSWEKGYGDFHLKLDLNTIRIADWLYKTAIILCDLEKNHTPVNASPREILKNGKYGTLFNIGEYKKLSKIILNYTKNSSNFKKKVLPAFKSLERFDYKKNCEQYLKLIIKHI